ncbi:hypothetical protein BBK36DRAFT_1160941 [Trichoderma citrinoviride]|uniref:Uncharacterized protein n=1 Tax=Trichoderma citrinoviride TaxID=58853 RepID=A0A2T4B621_9HYPO|nr:hypothetical protein BBK36DRAFT_1160941 [Trichoderma citrinoviride]PTB64775.1 hypothetical protein BBK36DRAFT_1160941 [Trichoderma citrinoviride]
MKCTSLLLTLLPSIASVALALALPAEQAQNSGIDPNRRFTCPAKVQDFCSASNIHSGCTADGRFTSSAMDTCGECRCS